MEVKRLQGSGGLTRALDAFGVVVFLFSLMVLWHVVHSWATGAPEWRPGSHAGGFVLSLGISLLVLSGILQNRESRGRRLAQVSFWISVTLIAITWWWLRTG